MDTKTVVRFLEILKFNKLFQIENGSYVLVLERFVKRIIQL
jgi:hypothetical protein